mmetsp:Transcript_11061/g.27175  ORF Transcript_11061/g.27175 Transcript_11061/m.27175 type:complete len:134 (+) Transcript_11061:101-502(+)
MLHAAGSHDLWYPLMHPPGKTLSTPREERSLKEASSLAVRVRVARRLLSLRLLDNCTAQLTVEEVLERQQQLLLNLLQRDPWLQRRHAAHVPLGVGYAAGRDPGEVLEVVRDVQGKAVHAPPASHIDPDGRDL